MKIGNVINEWLIKPHPKFRVRLVSKYILAQDLEVSPPMIDKWLDGDYKGVSKKVVDHFKDKYNIEITGYQSVMCIKDGRLHGGRE